MTSWLSENLSYDHDLLHLIWKSFLSKSQYSTSPFSCPLFNWRSFFRSLGSSLTVFRQHFCFLTLLSSCSKNRSCEIHPRVSKKLRTLILTRMNSSGYKGCGNFLGKEPCFAAQQQHTWRKSCWSSRIFQIESFLWRCRGKQTRAYWLAGYGFSWWPLRALSEQNQWLPHSQEPFTLKSTRVIQLDMSVKLDQFSQFL